MYPGDGKSLQSAQEKETFQTEVATASFGQMRCLAGVDTSLWNISASTSFIRKLFLGKRTD